MTTSTFRFGEFEEAALHVQRISGPWNLGLEIGAGGRIDLDRMTAAVTAAADRHPLARARLPEWSALDAGYQWLVPDTFDLDPVRAEDVSDATALANVRSRLYATEIPLQSAPAFRVVVGRRPGGDLVLMAFSSVAFDQTAAYRFAQSVAAAYRDAADPVDPVSFADARAGEQRAFGGALKDWAARAVEGAKRATEVFSPPARVAPEGASDSDGTGVVTRAIDPDEVQRLLADRPDRSTLNDVLIAATSVAIARWNEEHGATAGRVSVMVPVNTRPLAWFRDVVGNFTSFVSVSTDPDDRADVRAATAALAEQTGPVRRARRSGTQDVVALGKVVPVGVRRALPLVLPLIGHRLVDTALVANLGPADRPPHFDGDGPTEVWFSPPAAMPVGVGVGAVSVAGVLHLAVRYRSEQFDGTAAERFTDLLLDTLGVQARLAEARPTALRPTAPARPQYEVAIVGAGFSGLCMAIKLKDAGISNFVLFEKAEDIGGTWHDNVYPGCACDVPSHLYSYSFEPNPHWSRMFAPQEEIWAYQRRCAQKYGIYPHIQCGREVVRAEWDGEHQYWWVTTKDGETVTARVFVSAVGALSIPAYPRVPGVENFTGKTFHSARWDHSYDLAGKTVAVVGTGASAIQFVPRIQPLVERLDLYQRTPPWVLSKPDREITSMEKTVFENVPLAQRAARSGIYFWMEARVLGLAVDPRAMKVAEMWGRRYITKTISDPVLRAKVTPDYSMGCKRILMSDEYYPALAQANVDVITESIESVGSDSIMTSDGVRRRVDAIIYGTGFQVSDAFGPLEIHGTDGREIHEDWKRGGMEAYLGMSVAGYPNFFILLGPNTGLGHTSIIFMIEAQVHYAMQAIQLLLGDGLDSLDVRPEVQRAFNNELQTRLEKAVWSAGGCRSWYLDEFGKNRTLWPSFTFEYWQRTRAFEPDKYTHA